MRVWKKLYGPLTKTNEDISWYVTKTLTDTSIGHSKALENVNDKHFEKTIDRDIKASFLKSPLSKITKSEQTSQFSVVKGPNSNGVNYLLINRTIAVLVKLKKFLELEQQMV